MIKPREGRKSARVSSTRISRTKAANNRVANEYSIVVAGRENIRISISSFIARKRPSRKWAPLMLESCSPHHLISRCQNPAVEVRMTFSKRQDAQIVWM